MHDNMASADEPASMECIMKSELFPKKSLICEDESLHVPFPLLCGEAVEFLGRTADGVIALSNFRLLVRSKESFINVPLGMVEYIESKEIFYLYIYCKDATVVRCDFSNNDSCQDWFRRISQRTGAPKELNSLFAFAFFAWCQDRSPCPSEHEACYQLCQQGDQISYSFGKEVDRMKFDLKSKKAWRITYINEDFSVCGSYPKNHIVPACLTDKQLKEVAGFRSQRRFPSVVWRDQRNGSVLLRCSQPELGWLGWRSNEDEAMLNSVPVACSQNPGSYSKYPGINDDLSGSESSSQNGDAEDKKTENKMVIMDCRSYSAALANRAKGGGVECAEYYPNAEIKFMNLANIHAIRKSFIALRALCSGGTDQPNWLSTLENSKWFTYLSALLKTALVVVSSIDKEGKPVLVHCSDGWDRTTQIIALAELLLDPYYRTLEGFQILVEREWLEFGHKFADRCGNGVNTEDLNERSPVFLQWLDCVYQLYHQFPCAFQFNEAYLVKLMQHTYSHLFGTFLCNSTKDRETNQLGQRTASVWSLLNSKNNKFVNHLYCPSLEQHVLYPSYNVRSLELWVSVYLSNNTSRTSSEDFSTDKQTNDQDPICVTCNLQKTRSCENLLANQEVPLPSPSRRKSDPSIALDNFELPVHQAKETENKNASSQNISDVKEKEISNDSKVSKSIQLENGHEPHINGVLMNGDSPEIDKLKLLDNQIIISKHSDSSDCDEKLGKNNVPNGQVNGHACDSDNENSGSPLRTLIKTSSEKTLCDRPSEHGIDSSTDTLVEDENDLSRVNGRLKLVSRSVENLNPAKTAVDKLKSLEGSCTISTSTSEISNSSIELAGSNEVDNLRNLKCLLHQSNALKLSIKTNGCVKQTTNGSLSPNKLYPTPASSRTPNSTCPPTPGADSKSTAESNIQKQLSGISRQLDVDGLTIFNDPVQQRMQQMKSDYERQIQLLTAQLDEARIALLQHASACNGAGRCILENFREDMLMSPDSNGEMNSLGGCSIGSDVSWEQLDESDAKIVKWVPDYVVTHCAGCNTGFGIVKRKHHCRNCGNIFCHDCSNHYIAIPHQNLVGEERVCSKCYGCLQNKLPFNGMIDERPLAAAASN